jgi:ribonuclease D
VKGRYHQIALLQLASANFVAMFQLGVLEEEYYRLRPEEQFFPLPPPLLELLMSPRVLKVGVGACEDGQHVASEFGYPVRGCCDIDTAFCSPRSLQGLCALLLGFYHDKGPALSNWEAHKLTPTQINYAGALQLFVIEGVSVWASE